MTEASSLILAATPRSGSWLLAEGLRRLGTSGRPEEYFAANAEAAYRELWRLPVDDAFGPLLERILRAGRTRNGVFAAKIHWSQLPGLLYRLRGLSAGSNLAGASDLQVLEHHLGPLTVVYLTRTDTLRQAISWHLAMCSGRWWVTRDEQADEDHDDPTEFDFYAITTLAALLEEHKRLWESWFETNGVSPLRLSYEQVCQDYPGSLRTIASALGVRRPSRIAPTTLIRQADDRTEHWVGRYQASWRRVFGASPQLAEWV